MPKGYRTCTGCGQDKLLKEFRRIRKGSRHECLTVCADCEFQAALERSRVYAEGLHEQLMRRDDDERTGS